MGVGPRLPPFDDTVAQLFVRLVGVLGVLAALAVAARGVGVLLAGGSPLALLTGVVVALGAGLAGVVPEYVTATVWRLLEFFVLLFEL
jgi:hypothetical protein